MADTSPTVGIPHNFRPDGERLLIALRGSGESYFCSEAALSALRSELDEDAKLRIVQALLLRIHAVSSAIMDALNEPGGSVPAMLETIEGRGRHV